VYISYTYKGGFTNLYYIGRINAIIYDCQFDRHNGLDYVIKKKYDCPQRFLEGDTVKSEITVRVFLLHEKY
jgi:hypothetical protein